MSSAKELPSIEYSPSQLNFLKLSLIVIDEFPKALRKVFKTMWDKKYPAQLWDDSVSVHNKLRDLEGDSPKIPIGTTYEKWDCNALFQATIDGRTFKDPTGKTLNSKYLMRSRPQPRGSFRSTVTSSKGNEDETFALAIDQLRLLRKTFLHCFNTHTFNKDRFDDYIKHTKMAFTALHYSTDRIDKICGIKDSYFPMMEETIKEMQDAKRKRMRTLSMLFSFTLKLLAIIFMLCALYYITNGTTVEKFGKSLLTSGLREIVYAVFDAGSSLMGVPFHILGTQLTFLIYSISSAVVLSMLVRFSTSLHKYEK